mgnify:CR=1 FL=1
MKHAELIDLEEIMDVFKQYKDVFPHIRSDKIERMVKSGNVVWEEKVLITYNWYKRKQKLGYIERSQFGDFDMVVKAPYEAQENDCILHQIAAKNQGDGSGKRVFERFLEFNNGREFFTVSGSITGYENFPTGETGVLFSSGQFSGIEQFSGSGAHILSDPLYGFVPSGSGYFTAGDTYTGSGNIQFPESGQFYYREVAQEDLLNAVTGFNVFSSGFTGVTETDIYVDVDVTGVIWTGSGVGDPLYSADQQFITNDGETILTGEGATGDYSYNPDTLSYKGQRGGDYVEYILNSNSNINYIADYGFSSLVGKDSFFVDPEYANRGEEINLFLNGVYQNTGEKVAGPPDPNNILNPLAPTVLINEGNYVLNNTTIESTGSLFGPQEGVIYDEDGSDVKGRLEITDVDQYLGAPFPEIPVVDSVIFFNGQKIYEGVDWQDAGGFTPIGDILTMVGTFVARGKYSNDDSVVVASNDLYDIKNPYGENFVAFINGIRAPKEDFVYYSSGINLIDARKNLIELPQRELYNITAYKTFF